jgi:hypothetical protein
MISGHHSIMQGKIDAPADRRCIASSPLYDPSAMADPLVAHAACSIANPACVAFATAVRGEAR